MYLDDIDEYIYGPKKPTKKAAAVLLRISVIVSKADAERNCIKVTKKHVIIQGVFRPIRSP